MNTRYRHILAAMALVICIATAAAGAAERALTLESIEVRGNTRTSAALVTRYLGLSPGDEVTVDALEAGRARVMTTGYFSSVEVYTRRGSERGAVVAIVDVEEHGNPVFETGFGYHDLNGWFLTLLGLRLDNVLGADSQTRVGLRIGFHLTWVDAEWRKAIADEGRLGLRLRLHAYNIEHRFYGAGPGEWGSPGWTEYQQDIGRGGAEAGITYAAGSHTTFGFGMSAEYVEPDSTFRYIDKDDHETKYAFDDLPGSLQPGVGGTSITGFFLRAVRDTRNHLDYPTAGSFARFTLAINNSILGGDVTYTRADLDLSRHLHLGQGWVLSSHAAGGIVSEGAPYYDRYYIGGSYSIRGFQEWSLSATDGDDGYWMINEELRWPLAGRRGNAPRLVGLVFADAGQGWRRGTALTTSGVESSLGYGVRLNLPWVGMLGLDVGVPMSRGRTGDPFWVHGSLGFSF